MKEKFWVKKPTTHLQEQEHKHFKGELVKKKRCVAWEMKMISSITELVVWIWQTQGKLVKSEMITAVMG